MTATKPLRLLPIPEILDRCGGGRTRLYDRIKDGTWLPLIKLGRASVLPEHEVELMVRAIVAGKTDDEMRELVRTIVAQRIEAFQTLMGHAA